MKKQSVTIYDVAREADVSMATVSRVVNGNVNVKPSTREKVLKVIEELDYRPNAVARGLASKKTTTVGVIIPDITNQYFSSFALGIDDVATMYKYNIIMGNADHGREEKVINDILSRQVDGVVYLGHALTNSARREFDRSRTPVVLAGVKDPEGKLPSVHINYEEAVSEVVDQLADSGYQHIAYVSSKEYQEKNQPGRFSGYLKGLQNHGMTLTEDLVFTAKNSRYKAGKEIAEQLLNSKADACVVIGDELATSIVNHLQAQGIKIPDDFGLVSSNNSILTEIVHPQLSSIAPPLYDIGAVAMRLLTKLMGEEIEDEDDLTIDNVLPYKIVYRDSTR